MLELYKKYYADRDHEQVDLFQQLKNKFSITKVLYAGSFVHISPSFVFPDTVYIDADKQAIKFFKQHTQVSEYIDSRKQYTTPTRLQFYGQDYHHLIPEHLNNIDLLISQYAGFISQACKAYLKPGGLLLVNNSHADAGLAALDEQYELVATIQLTHGKYRISDTNLTQYFIPKRDLPVSQEYLQQLGKGIAYTQTAPLYLFRYAA